MLLVMLTSSNQADFLVGLGFLPYLSCLLAQSAKLKSKSKLIQTTQFCGLNSPFLLATAMHKVSELYNCCMHVCLSLFRITFCLPQGSFTNVDVHLLINIQHYAVHGPRKARNSPVHDPM